MKFKMNFGKIKTIILLIVLLGALAIIGLDISLIVRAVKGMVTTISIASTSLCAGVLIAIFSLLVLFNSFYVLNDNYFEICLGFFIEKIQKEDLISVAYNKDNYILFLVTKGAKDKNIQYRLKINIKKESIDSFLDNFKSAYPNILIDFIDKDEQ